MGIEKQTTWVRIRLEAARIIIIKCRLERTKNMVYLAETERLCQIPKGQNSSTLTLWD